MDIINKTVRHKTFGEGEICDFRDNIISVRFGAAQTKFIFPDAFRDHLILTEKKSKQYVDGILARIDRDKQFKREKNKQEAEKKRFLRTLPLNAKSQAAFGFIDNDMQSVKKDWRLNSGYYRSGSSRGQPRTPARLYPNSACLLTCLGEKEPEENRYIWGVFMVRDDFNGPECMDGVIEAHDTYRILLKEEEKKDFLFWKYFGREPEGRKTKWGSIEFRYFANTTMARILDDIQMNRKGAEKKHCGEFLEYFCELNKIDKIK